MNEWCVSFLLFIDQAIYLLENWVLSAISYLQRRWLGTNRCKAHDVTEVYRDILIAFRQRLSASLQDFSNRSDNDHQRLLSVTNIWVKNKEEILHNDTKRAIWFINFRINNFFLLTISSLDIWRWEAVTPVTAMWIKLLMLVHNPYDQIFKTLETKWGIKIYTYEWAWLRTRSMHSVINFQWILDYSHCNSIFHQQYLPVL